MTGYFTGSMANAYDELPLIGAEYVHKKGNKYIVVGLAHHTETNEILVIYSHSDHPNTLWARPVNIFMDGRFKLVDD